MSLKTSRTNVVMKLNTRRWGLRSVNGLIRKGVNETWQMSTSIIHLTAAVSFIRLFLLFLQIKSLFIAPTHPFCDNRDGTAINVDASTECTQPQRPSTPISTNPFPGNAQASPSKSADANGKRKMVQPNPPTRRTGKHLENANTTLENWRFKTVRRTYTLGLFTFTSFLPDTVLKTLAAHSNIQSVEDMKTSSNGSS